MVVEKNFPNAHGYYEALDRAAGAFPDSAGRLVVSEEQHSSDLILEIVRPDGSREHNSLPMWNQMALYPNVLDAVLRDKIRQILAR